MNGTVKISWALSSPRVTKVQRPSRCFLPRPSRSVKAMASLTVKESGTGVEFPLVERLWYVFMPLSFPREPPPGIIVCIGAALAMHI